ncbi:hypothetical protein DSL72_001773 [Monilinia vaccinii-corymbosi]|uniref:DUF427 domain-containing protein n=1 Tax=Monilinia vaccinii-corymbosi TaxID=61207 RepID=A0A8A3PAS1_9HELO|nr:hypothetical protein DSL72_001773 [Monilinia vaccinii-corymbosi]
MPSGKATATVNGRMVAETDNWEVVEGNVYFPPSSVKQAMLSKTDHKTELNNAAWYYATPFEKAKNIKDYVAFYKNVVDVKAEEK